MVCKYLLLFTKRLYILSFILTKWYVNEMLVAIADKLGLRFILTKWYVNHIYTASEVVEEESFILTKWYVNVLSRFLSTQRFLVLY